MEAIASPRLNFINNKNSIDQMKEMVAMFGARLGANEIEPEGMANALVLFGLDVERGIDGFTGKPFTGRWGNDAMALKPMMKRLLMLTFIKDLEQYLPVDFAIETQRIYKELTAP